MSQAVIEFCDGLKTLLLGLEERLVKARQGLDESASEAQSEARRHLDEAVEQLEQFKVKAARMAEAVRAEAPEIPHAVEDKLKGFGQEAQTAMRHAVVFLAEAASKGAAGAAAGLAQGARRAHAFADSVRRQTAVAPAPEPGAPDDAG